MLIKVEGTERFYNEVHQPVTDDEVSRGLFFFSPRLFHFTLNCILASSYV